MSKAIVKGSLSDVAQRSNSNIAEAFLEVEYIVLIDTSGSMDERDVDGGSSVVPYGYSGGRGKSRYEAACEQLENLQRKYPGQLAVISFSSEVMFCPDGVPHNFGQGTVMKAAFEYLLRFGIQHVQDIGVVVVSDGLPFDPEQSINNAKELNRPVHTIYIGTDRDGEEFMRRLAYETGGKRFAGSIGQDMLEEKVTLLLEAGKSQLADGIIAL